MAGSPPDADCPCIISKGGNCVDCGRPVENPEITVEQMAAEGIVLGPPPPPDVLDAMVAKKTPNFVGIEHLAKNTFREGVRRQVRNADPQNPNLPRLRMVGSMFIRIPHKDVWTEVLRQSFDQAKDMGFSGDITRWTQIVEEAAPAQ
jgi:hypothetical protein